jgi:hypothetical protein
MSHFFTLIFAHPRETMIKLPKNVLWVLSLQITFYVTVDFYIRKNGRFFKIMTAFYAVLQQTISINFYWLKYHKNKKIGILFTTVEKRYLENSNFHVVSTKLFLVS